ncbi:MAG TPA: DUF4175 family protein, partial [Rhizomicrobium sp.]
MDELNQQDPERPLSPRLMLARAVKRARGSLFWERLWPALASVAVAVGFFLALSWAGLWIMLPPWPRAVAVVLVLLVVAVSAIPLLRLRLPSEHEGLSRLDRGSGEKHRPATAIADAMAANREDPVAQALWRAHIERALISARKLKAGWPQPRLGLRDPMALRALTFILVVATFFAASGERVRRVTAAFDWQGVVTPANFRVDAWVTPPLYTGRPPVMLPGLRPGDTAQNAAEPVAVPAGSQLVIRATGRVSFDIARVGGVEEAPPDAKASLPAGTEERRFVINGDGSATLRGVGRTSPVWTFSAIPDRAPAISLVKEPERQARGALRLDYRMDDDYGVIDAKATFALKEPPVAGKERHPLYASPDYPLTLPQARARSGIAQTTHDLTEHPLAGAEVLLTLVARDEAGNEGR